MLNTALVISVLKNSKQIKMTVEDPVTGKTLGTIKQKWSWCGSRIRVLDPEGQDIALIVGPWWRCGIVRFQIFTPTKPRAKIGVIQKMFAGVAQESRTEADNFNVSFPVEMDVQHKILMVAATFLIDYMYFEDQESHSCLFNYFCICCSCLWCKCCNSCCCCCCCCCR